MDDFVSQGVSDLPVLATEVPVAEEDAATKQEVQDLKDLSYLSRSAAWAKMRKRWDKRIDEFERLRTVDMTKLSNEEVGAECKVARGVANELRAFMAEIDGVVEVSNE
jgi:hypothetical protein